MNIKIQINLKFLFILWLYFLKFCAKKLIHFNDIFFDFLKYKRLCVNAVLYLKKFFFKISIYDRVSYWMLVFQFKFMRIFKWQGCSLTLIYLKMHFSKVMSMTCHDIIFRLYESVTFLDFSLTYIIEKYLINISLWSYNLLFDLSEMDLA